MHCRKSVLASLVEILTEHRHVCVAVVALVLVPQSDRMSNLMCNGIGVAAVRRYGNPLFPADHPNLRPAIP